MRRHGKPPTRSAIILTRECVSTGLAGKGSADVGPHTLGAPGRPHGSASDTNGTNQAGLTMSVDRGSTGSDRSRPFAYVDPAVSYATRTERRVTRPQQVPLVDDLDYVCTLNDVEPLVLIAM